MRVRAGLVLGSTRLFWLAAVTLAQAGVASRVEARARGLVVDNCTGCHGGGAVEAPELSLTAEPATFQPGDLVTLSLSIRWPSIRVGGAYVWTEGVGAFQPLSGEGLAAAGQGLTHSAPKAAANGVVTLRFGWRAPATPGAVDFGVAALAGNGNNASGGDSPGFRAFSWVYGCTGRSIFPDLDRDGHGSKALGTKLICEDAPVPEGYAAKDGDCDENSEQVYPGALEVCNKRDDNCDGQVDEGASPVPMWPDGDGDGFYAHQTGTAKSGCGNVPGYAAVAGDCNDLDPSINPGAQETCNNKDDNCNGDVDERVRPQCGVGWCARYSPSCNVADCQPGPPRAETCNAFDDDCDGELDNAACSADQVCSNGQCLAPGTPPEPPQSSTGGSPPMMTPAMGGGTAVTAGSPATNPAARAQPSSGCSLGGARVGYGPWLLTSLLVALRSFSRRVRSSSRGGRSVAPASHGPECCPPGSAGR